MCIDEVKCTIPQTVLRDVSARKEQEGNSPIPVLAVIQTVFPDHLLVCAMPPLQSSLALRPPRRRCDMANPPGLRPFLELLRDEVSSSIRLDHSRQPISGTEFFQLTNDGCCPDICQRYSLWKTRIATHNRQQILVSPSGYRQLANAIENDPREGFSHHRDGFQRCLINFLVG